MQAYLDSCATPQKSGRSTGGGFTALTPRRLIPTQLPLTPQRLPSPQLDISSSLDDSHTTPPRTNQSASLNLQKLLSPNGFSTPIHHRNSSLSLSFTSTLGSPTAQNAPPPPQATGPASLQSPAVSSDLISPLPNLAVLAPPPVDATPSTQLEVEGTKTESPLEAFLATSPAKVVVAATQPATVSTAISLSLPAITAPLASVTQVSPPSLSIIIESGTEPSKPTKERKKSRKNSNGTINGPTTGKRQAHPRAASSSLFVSAKSKKSSMAEPELFVADLPDNVTEEELRQFFLPISFTNFVLGLNGTGFISVRL